MLGTVSHLSGATYQMDEIVEQIFATMMDCACVPSALPCGPADLHVRVLFARSCCTSCEISLDYKVADALARLLTGAAGEELRSDDELADVAGELCNMIAGGWKTRRSAEGAIIAMTPPRTSVLPHEISQQEPRPGFSAAYAFPNGRFTVHLCCTETHQRSD